MSENKSKLAFKKENYYIMLIGIALILAGFVIMSIDSQPFGFGFLGLTLGPLILFLGLITQFVAILYNPVNKDKR